MLRFVLPSTILLTALPAAAERPTPAEMTEAKDLGEACTEARDMLPATATCTVRSKVDIKGFGTAELLEIQHAEITQYAISLRMPTTYLVSSPVQFVSSNCGMMKCDVIDRMVPKLRALKNGMVALEISIQAHHEYTDERGPKVKQVITDRWDQASIIVCGGRAGSIECVNREWGGRYNSCTVKVGDDGNVTSSCTTTEPVGL